MPPWRGLNHVTGEPDTGKTTFCLTVPGVKPGEIIFFDSDLKTRALAESFEKVGHPFWGYYDLTTLFKESGKQKPIDFYKMVMDKVDACLNRILRGDAVQPKVCVFDNWSPMETGIRSYSESIMSLISDLSPGQQKAMSQMTWSYTYEEYARVLGEFLKLAPMFFITTHVREKYLFPGVLEARGQRPLTEKSTFRVWLRHNPDGPAPIGLILKRIQRMMVTDESIKPVNVLPRRVKPLTWGRIFEYFDNPLGDAQPNPEEIPNDFELSILDGVLTADQKDALHSSVNKIKEEAAAEEAESAAMADEQMRERARELKAEGNSLPDIVKEFGGAVTPARVAEWLRSPE